MNCHLPSYPEVTMFLDSSLPTQTHSIGPAELRWDAEGGVLSLSVDGHQVWSSLRRQPFLACRSGESTVHESRGFFDVQDRPSRFTVRQTIDRIQSTADEELELSGQLSLKLEFPPPLRVPGREHGVLKYPWRLRIGIIDAQQISFVVDVDGIPGEPRVLLRHACDPTERFYGFGEQLTHLDLKGKKLDILSQEPGIGRGVQPLTWVMNAFAGAGGGDTRSSAPAPHYITSQCRSLALENHELSRFDLQQYDRVEVEVWSSQVRARVFVGRSPAELIQAYTRFSGRMPPLPSWLQKGAVIGMQGGTAAVRAMAARLKAANTPVAAFWLQDWVGARKTSVGSQLWWNWELDPKRYPEWDTLRAELEALGARVLSYINPFLVDVSERAEDCRRNLYQEALEKGFLVSKADGSAYLVQNTSFSAAMVDLSNPAARTWLKEVIKEQVIGAGASGWMADFGEALPFDAKLHDGDAAVFHNAYPEAWAQLNREAIAEAGREGDVVFFVRSGFTRSPGHATLFWAGDQLTGWAAEDGIKCGVTALLSSGFSGFAYNHTDIGGYITTAIPGFPLKIPFLDYRRSRELLWRWIELNAFTAVFRTHEGNQPGRNTQIDEDDATTAHFARFARVYAALAEVREGLGEEAAKRGLPVVRHPWLCFPDDPATPALRWQFCLGPFMVAPVLDRGATQVSLYLPAGEWVHLWSGATVDAAGGGWFSVDAPLGQPAVFYPQGAPLAEGVRSALAASDDLSASPPGIQSVAAPVDAQS